MRRSIELLIGEMESKLGGYAGLLNYRFMNLCVKAEPAALLTVVVMSSDGERLNLEKVARARLANKFQYEIVPMSSDLLAPICKGFMDAHPEFKQEVVTPDDDHRIYPNQEDEKHIFLTVPEVNLDRHDSLMDAVKLLYDQCKAQVDKVNASYAAKLATKVAELPKADIEEAKEKMENSQKMYSKMCEDYLSAKQQEIEEAYQHYLADQTAKQTAADEKAAARGVNAGQQFNINQEDE